MGFSPTAQELLAGRVSSEALDYPARCHNPLYREPEFSRALKVLAVVRAVAEECGSNPAAIAAAWTLAQPNVLTAIVGSRKPSQVPEFASAGSLVLSGSQLQRLTDASDLFVEG
jgi:aryl-alcohol dehydrogenase-like predicted oxidoreductase